jgi:hypothetical protein
VRLKDQRQQQITEYLRSKKVVVLRHLYEQFPCSELTLRNDIRDIGGINSYTHQRSFVTLSDIPIFNEHGVWFFRGVGFTKFETSIDLVAHLIATSKSGLTREQIQEVTKIQVGQQIRELLLREQLYRVKVGNKYLYIPEEIARNRRKRFRIVGDLQVEEHYESEITTNDLIAVLKVVLQETKIDMKQLKRWIKKYSLKMSVLKLERLIAKYKLDEKKTP